VAEVKFCGLTRREDVAHAVALGAAFVGVIFAGGPRQRTAEQARELFAAVPAGSPVRRVGVFGAQTADAILDVARTAQLDVLQLHGASEPALVRALRAGFGGDIWRVVRVPADTDGAALAASLRTAAVDVDAVVVDALVPGQLGGTGVPVNWTGLGEAWSAAGRPVRLVLAGGLTAGNVALAVRVARPQVADVSSGVEMAPGIKDQSAMRAFMNAARESEG
jgi:phosphoribosylanthranilate isomerase